MVPRHKPTVVALFALYILLAGWYSVMVPPGEGLDELPHFDYVLFIKDHQQLPVQLSAGAVGATWMGHHPPLYYLLSAVLIAPFDTTDRYTVLQFNPHFRWDEQGTWGWNVVLPSAEPIFPWAGTILALQILRLSSIFWGGVTLVFVYLSVRRLLPGRAWAAAGAVALVGLNPSYLYMASIIHHDVFLTAVYSAGIYWCLRIFNRPITLLDLVAGGLLVGAAMLTKLSGVTLAGIVTAAVLFRPRHTSERLPRLGQLLLTGGVALALTGWWFARNLLLYGDLLGWDIFMNVHAHIARPSAFTWGLFVHEFLAQFVRTFWGAFGYMHILLPEWLRMLAWSLTGLAGIGWLFWLARILRRPQLTWQTVAPWGLLLWAFGLVFLAFTRFAVTTGGAGHGRYLLVAAIPIGALQIAGLNGFLRWRYSQAITLALVLGLGLYAVLAPIHFVWPRYESPKPPTQAELARAQSIEQQFDGGIRLVAATADSAIVIPGQGLEIVTYWRADPLTNPVGTNRADATHADAHVHMALVMQDGTLLDARQFWPDIGSIPAVWGDRTIANRQAFYISPEQPSGSVAVQIRITNGPDGPTLARHGEEQDSDPLIVLSLLALGAVTPVSESELPTPLRTERFAQSLDLVGTTLPATVTPGAILPVSLYWRVAATPDTDYTVFIHVLDAQDRIVAQLDRPPGGGTSPTTGWQTGQILYDTYPVPLPDTLLNPQTEGLYRVRMGLYTWPDLVRQPVERDGAPLGDSLIIGEFSISAP